MDPTEALQMASGGATVLGKLFGGITSLISGNEQEAQEKAAAQRADLEAGVNAQQDLQRGNETAARAATQAAANGGGLVGSSLGVVSQASRNAYFNARTDTYRGLTQAANDDYQGEIAHDNGVNALIGSFIGAGGSAASSAGDDQYRQSILQSNAFRQGDVSSYDLQGLF